MKSLLLVGNPVSHSIGPAMHNAALKAMNLNNEFHYDKKNLVEDDLCNLVTSIELGEIEGANITIPYKTAIMSFLSKVTKTAELVGAVNTIYKIDSEVVGENTDVPGFLKALEENGVNPRNQGATILGAGGAARAISYALVQSGVSNIDIFSRSERKAENLAISTKQHGNVRVNFGVLPTCDDSVIETDLLVNCTPVGMTGHSAGLSPIPIDVLSSDTTVVDIVYNPRSTKLLEDADKVGCRVIDGVEMLVHQGALSFEYWIGSSPPIGVMRKEVLQFLGERSNES